MKKKIICLLLVLSLVLSGFSFAFADSVYTVKPGDVLWKIAKQFGTGWQELAEYNKLTNANLIFPNQKITVPGAPVIEPVPTAFDQAMDALKIHLAPEINAYLDKVEPTFAYDIAYELSKNPKYLSSDLGTRTAGSAAEHAAADYLLGVMKEIGLTNTEKAAAKVDKWQFNGADLKLNGDDRVIKAHSYATAATPSAGITAEIVYMGDGTMWDYEAYQGDVTGKIVLIDIDMRANWWITYPMLEAEFQGAAAIMNSSVSGFSEISKDAYNANDICGPTSIPTVSITQNDAEYIKGLIEKNGTVTGTLRVDNIVKPDGTSYNVVGKIKGKNSDQQIMVGAHYDMYFEGFQDDNAAVGLTLAMAKAMIDSGYVPENDILFVLHGAEEWGSSYTPFDWTIGAWRMINEIHPEWVGKTLAFINFELPAYEFETYTSVYSAPEMYSLIDTFVNKGFAPKPQGCFPDGVLTDGYQTYTYSDDFSYYAAGVPSTVNGFLLQKDMASVFPFYYKYYHTNFDTPDTYDEDVMNFNTEFYGSLAIYIDQLPAMDLDFTSQYQRLSAALDEAIATKAGADVKAYRSVLAELKVAAQSAKDSVSDINIRYAEAIADGADQKTLDSIRDEGKALNAKNLKTFKFVQDEFLGLMYERPLVPHEAPQDNIRLMESIVDALSNGDVITAVDEYAWQVNNVNEWYPMYFSPEVTDIFNDMFYGVGNQDNLFWGTGKSFVPAQVEDATRSIFARYEEKNGDFTKEIAIYEAAINAQEKVLKEKINQEITAMKKFVDMLK